MTTTEKPHVESTRAMTRERGSPAESKNCEILLLPTADRRFDTKVKCPTGRASFWVKLPTVRSLTRVKCPGIARGAMDGFGRIDWYINWEDWLGSPVNIKVTNKDIKIYVGRSTTLHNLLFSPHTLCTTSVTSTFLLVSSSVWSKQLFCFVQGQG